VDGYWLPTKEGAYQQEASRCGLERFEYFILSYLIKIGGNFGFAFKDAFLRHESCTVA